MRWTRKLGEVAGIGIFVHWSFLLLVGWIVLLIMNEGGSFAAALQGIFFVLTVFGCVVLHELGHALAARRYGIRTRDITLLPIGGVARLERMPREPRQEFVVAAAGPAVNAVIAAGLFVVTSILLGIEQLGGSSLLGTNFLVSLLRVNILIILFNLLPAFPMDGGRILRASLAMMLPYGRATRIAATIGQILAILLALVGLLFLQNPFLAFIGVFVFFGAQREARMVERSRVGFDAPVSEAMMRRFRTLEIHEPLTHATELIIDGGQQDFPVLENKLVVGILTRKDLLEAISKGREDERVGDIMRPSSPAVLESDSLRLTFQRMIDNEWSMIPVVRSGYLVGILTLRDIREWMRINSSALRV